MNNKTFPYAFFESKFVKTEQAKLSIMTNSVQYGIGVFDSVRGYYNKERKNISLFTMSDHYKRLLTSIKIVGAEIPYVTKELEQITIELVKKNKPTTDVYFRPYAYAPGYGVSPDMYANSKFDFALYMITLGEYLPVDKGLNVMVSSWRRISDNAIPARAKICGGYINSSLGRGEAARLGFDEAIMLTHDGHVAEGSAENFFMVKNGVLITPSQTDDILEGITRKCILEIAKDLGIPTEIRTIDRTELYTAEEAFFSGTGVQVAWIGKIDDHSIGIGKRGPITKKLQELFFSIVHGNEKQYDCWCTKIRI